MRTDNTKGDEIAALVRRIEKLERQAPAGFTSITRGALRVASPEGLIVEGSEKVTGTLDVTGTLTVSGTINGDGTITWAGPVTFTGATNLNGPIEVNGASHFVGLATVDGDMDVNGTLNVDGPAGINGPTFLRGSTELTGDLTVDGGGKIHVGGMTLDPAVSGAGTVGGISAPVTLLLSAPTVQMTSSARVVGLLNAAGGVSLTNLPTIPGKTSNLYIDPNDLYKLKIIV